MFVADARAQWVELDRRIAPCRRRIRFAERRKRAINGEATVAPTPAIVCTRNRWSAKHGLRRFWWTLDLVQRKGLAA